VVRYRSKRPDDGALRARLRELAGERRRFGYRRLGYLLDREGLRVNRKRLFRLYREEGLKVRRRGGRKRALGTRAPAALPQGPNQRWSLDFVSDAFTDGRRFRVLAVVCQRASNNPQVGAGKTPHSPSPRRVRHEVARSM
jgi:putative transposase